MQRILIFFVADILGLDLPVAISAHFSAKRSIHEQMQNRSLQINAFFVAAMDGKKPRVQELNSEQEMMESSLAATVLVFVLL